MEETRYLVQIPEKDAPGEAAIADRLKQFGLKMDREYGLVRLPVAEPKLLGRALGTPENFARCQKETGWQFFPDLGFRSVR